MSSHNWSGEGLLALHTAVREGSRMLPRAVRSGILRSVAGAPRDVDRAEVESTPLGWSLVVSRRGVAVLAAAFGRVGGGWSISASDDALVAHLVWVLEQHGTPVFGAGFRAPTELGVVTLDQRGLLLNGEPLAAEQIRKLDRPTMCPGSVDSR